MLAIINPKVGAEQASILVRKYLEQVHGNLGLMGFQIEKVNQNQKENTWIVECSLYTSMGSENRTHYVIKVNIKTGKIDSIMKKD